MPPLGTGWIAAGQPQAAGQVVGKGQTEGVRGQDDLDVAACPQLFEGAPQARACVRHYCAGEGIGDRCVGVQERERVRGVDDWYTRPPVPAEFCGVRVALFPAVGCDDRGHPVRRRVFGNRWGIGVDEGHR
ncbi:hypothetical protein ADK43_09180 [Streptomyces rimosus subsp. rimosus]|nr:hypothetical protein ADK43_09180 [Streptomyces rimosus subsp. rimosus]